MAPSKQIHSGRNARLNLSFCDATINSIASGKIDASFSEVTSGEVGDISINSISSKYEFKKAGTGQQSNRAGINSLSTI